MGDESLVVVYSHGFGVDKTDRGLLSDIAQALPNTISTLFDYNDISEDGKTMTVRSFSEQVKLLHTNFEIAKQANPGLRSIIIGHSQGCVIAALAGIVADKMIFLAPAPSLSIDRIVKNFSEREGTEINIDGESRLMRRDGSVTLIGKEYWRELESCDPIDLYNNLAKEIDLTIIHATEDEVLGSVDYSTVGSAKIIKIAAGHNFEGSARGALVETLKKEL